MAESVGHTDDRGPAEMVPAKPMILAVDDDVDALRRLTRELKQRYGVDYDVVCQRSPQRALEILEGVRGGEQEVALVLADQEMPELGGAELLARVHRLHPQARRGLLVHWGDWAHPERSAGMLNGMAESRFDYYVLKPSRPGDEQFHRPITEFLYEWARTALARGARDHARGRRLGVAHARAARSTGAKRRPARRSSRTTASAAASCSTPSARAAEGPIAIIRDGAPSSIPTNPELARAIRREHGAG